MLKPTLNDYIFISVQPYDSYFAWQVEVQIVNFRKHGISDKMHVLVWSPLGDEKNGQEGNWRKLEEKYPEVSFYFYKNSGDVNVGLYISQLRPDALMQHFAKYPELKEKVIFYHDCDIIFNYLPDFTKLAEDNINWQSNTSGYLDYDYLRRKEKEGNIPENAAIKLLADIGNVSVDILKSYTAKTGGAQYILKGIDSDFWKDVKRQCIEIRKAFTHIKAGNVTKTPENTKILQNSVNTRYFPTEEAGFQSWCADMWAVNMALWNRDKITDITPELEFSWATDDIETYKKKPIYHNAGNAASVPGAFVKSHWLKINQSPIGKLLSVNPKSASKFYVDAIKEVK